MGDSTLWETCEETFKETYPLTPRGGFFDGRNQNRDSEPSAKTFHDSDKPTSLEILSFVIGLELARFGELECEPGTLRRVGM